LSEELKAVLDYSGQKISAVVLRLNQTGLIHELEDLPYRVGQIVKVEIFCPKSALPQIKDCRAIKSYDWKSKKISELHFIKLKETVRLAITNYLIKSGRGVVTKP